MARGFARAPISKGPPVRTSTLDKIGIGILLALCLFIAWFMWKITGGLK